MLSINISGHHRGSSDNNSVGVEICGTRLNECVDDATAECGR